MKQRTATAKKPAVFATYGPTASRALPETSFGSTDYSALKRHSSTAHSRLLQSFDQVKIAESSDIAVHVCLGVCSHHDAANGVDSSASAGSRSFQGLLCPLATSIWTTRAGISP